MTHTISTLDMATIAEATDNQGFGALQTERGLLPLVALDVRTDIRDLAAQTTIRQTFRNSLDEPLEATYIFPLPDRAAVTKFQMRVAGRVIDGDLKERGQAREEYDQAIEAGHRAAIAEEDRSGVFSLRVGNLPPHEEAVVELTLVGPLPVSDGEATFRFPLVVAPRYTPGVPLDGSSVGVGVSPDTDETPDASRVTPPVLLPGFPNPVRLSLEVRLDPAGAAASEANWKDRVRSSLHATLEDEGPPWTIRLQPGERLNRDFILRFPVAAKSLATSLSASAAAENRPGLFALSLLPPAAASAKPVPREVVFLLDRSGSMGGWKMVAARRALARMIDTLLDQDLFAVLAFDSTLEHAPHVKDNLIPATNRDRWQMLEWLGKIEARGGTELAPALETALAYYSKTPTRERHLVVVTDGQVSGEDAVLRRVSQAAGKELPRIFTVGIDQAVNGGFLRRLAELGRGNCELVESESRLDEAMNRIHRLIGTPVLTQVRIEPLNFDSVVASLAPAQMPDLFADRPVTVYGRHLSADGSIRLRVLALDAAGNPWQQEVVARPGPTELLTSMWGRAKVRELEDEYAAGRAGDAEALMQQIVSVSLESRVLSRFTAFVAVDRSEVVNEGGRVTQIVQPVEMPDGWDMTRGGAPMEMLFCATMPAPMARGGAAKHVRHKRAEVKKTHGMFGDVAGAYRGASPVESVDSFLQEIPESRIAYHDTSIDFTETSSVGEADYDANHPSIAKLIQLWIAEAIRLAATEIVIEPTTDRICVRYRVHGNLVDRDSPPLRLLSGLVGHIRMLAGLDGANPPDLQQGRFVLPVGSAFTAWGVQISQTPHGAAVTLTLESATTATEPPAERPKRKKFWA